MRFNPQESNAMLSPKCEERCVSLRKSYPTYYFVQGHPWLQVQGDKKRSAATKLNGQPVTHTFRGFITAQLCIQTQRRQQWIFVQGANLSI